MTAAARTTYGALISRAGRSRTGARVRRLLHRVTGAVLIALGILSCFVVFSADGSIRETGFT